VLATISYNAMQEKMDWEQENLQNEQKKQHETATTGLGSKCPVRSTATTMAAGLLSYWDIC